MSSLIHPCWFLSCCIFILVFKDCQSFFLRHTQSGKCIGKGNKISSNNWGIRYWVEMVSNCLDVGANFRYSSNEILKNIETGGSLASDYGSRSYNNRLFLYEGSNQNGKDFENNTKHSLKQRPEGSLYLNKVSSCAEPSKVNNYVDQKKDGCSNSKEQKFTFGSVTNSKMENVSCSPIQSMQINKAHYGDFDNSGTFKFSASIDIDKKCSSLTTCKVKNLCGGKRSCELTVDNDLLSPYCSYDLSKELYTEYTCVDAYKFSITEDSAVDVRLSPSANRGFIEIWDGTSWRKVDDKKWDKDRQKMLCQHLGFGVFQKNGLSRNNLGSNQKIATGDVVCYGTQSTGTSCCAHLEPSTTTSTVEMTYASCKVCDRPLLQNTKIFPDSVFSGVGGNANSQYNYARFIRNGWCSSGSGTVYLMIDLKKEYHITQVVTLGKKSQRKWGSSYSLRYSHDKTLVDGSSPEQITGNQNGYQASTTKIDIYNARYIKVVESTGINQFCLRIELCGEVQQPASVTVIATPSATSVHLSWTVPGPETSSYITQFIIYLDEKQEEISRDMQETYSLQISGLKPLTTYHAGIVAKDGSSERSEIKYTKFKTLEGVPSRSPANVRFDVRSKDALRLSWDRLHDRRLLNGELKGYQICHSTKENDQNPSCSTTTSMAARVSYTIYRLQPSTKYFVTVAAGTSAGYGQKSWEISKITIGEPVDPVANSYSSLRLNIAKQENYIKEVMIIVQVATRKPSSSDYIPTISLKPYQPNARYPYYVTAYFTVNDRGSTFVIGDGKEYNYNNEKYFNQPLKQNTSYNVFLRFFESQTWLFYSTQWSSSVRTMIKPPAPVISKPISTGAKEYQIFWSQPSLPEGQIVLNYHVNYSSPGGTSEVSNLTEKTKYVKVDHNKWYTFEIQVQTEAGRSDISSTSWQSYPEPLKRPEKTKDGYIAILKKPREDQEIRTVALVLLQLKSETSEIPSPENVTVEESAPENNEKDSVAFIAKEFNVKDFVGNSMKITLRERKDNRRRKRNVGVDILQSNTIYRSAQMNTDVDGDRKITSYWSPQIKTSGGDKGGGDGGNTGGNTGGNGGGNEGGPGERGDEDSGGSTGVAVGASLGVVVIVIAVVVAGIFFRKRMILKRKSGNEIVHNEDFDEMKTIENNANDGQDDVKAGDHAVNECLYSNETGMADEKTHSPVPVEEFAHYVNEMKAKDNSAFKNEYADLPKDMDTSWEVSKKPFNKKKNRYGNIVTYDYCRVVLSGDENEDYINASFIDGIKTNSYIASQGPNKLTVNDMWRMVWEQHSYSIVMVTSLVELGKPKCEKYWPDKGSEKYGDIEVTLMKTEEFAYHVSHTLQIKKNGEEREVRHYYFFSWPDHGVPKYPTQLLAFRRHFRTHHLEQSGPVVVHCSAGVGRTGVFLAIDTILVKLEKGLINSIDVFGQACAMRERRMNMIQTLEQYIFVHEAILETILCGMNEVDSTRILKEIDNLAQVKASEMTGFEEKFKRLGEVSPILSSDECAAALLEGNDDKNRNKNVFPAECNRVPLQYLDGVADSDYINAVFVHGYLGRNYFIATQSPLPNTINDFWRMVQMQKSSTIVLLNNVKDGTTFPKFWPSSRGKPMQYGKLTVQLDSETEDDAIWTRKLILSPYPDLTDGHVVNIFHYTKWPDHRVPTSANGVITLTSLVEKSRQSQGQGPVIVACSDGAGRTGAYIAISNLLERMKIEQAVDVFQSIKIIRGIRPQFVETAEQYQFCYIAMMAYLDAFSEYSNFD